MWFNQISGKDVLSVGGKNASLGEMYSKLSQKGINVPDGFALTSAAYWYFLKANKIDEKIKNIFLKFKRESLTSLEDTSEKIIQLIFSASLPEDLKKEILENYRLLSKKYSQNNLSVAVRSSATAEDSAVASFAGQHETFLNVSGEKELLASVKKCIASLFLARAIAYREEKKFDHLKIALSIGVQKMIKSDSASSGIIFTLDTETGFRDIVLINSIWGVGEMIVKGKITPDQFYIFKPTLKKGFKSIIAKNLGRKTIKYIFKKNGLKEVKVAPKDQERFSLNDEEIIKLANWACLIEEHYNCPQDLEWAKDGDSGDLFIVQSRPETIHGKGGIKFYEEYFLKTEEQPVLTGIAVGNKIGIGKVRLISDVSKMSQFQNKEVLVTKMTDPDWVPVMRKASAIITEEGGKTCHAAIVSRELGVPCIVGAQRAVKLLKNGQTVTVDCSQGSKGRIFLGKVSFDIKRYDLQKVPRVKTKIMMNIGSPEIALKTSFLPNDGVGLARMEFILAEKIKIHPLALYNFNKIKDKKLKKEIENLTIEYKGKDKKDYFINELAEGIALIAAAFYPKPVIVRFSDFKTNEYAGLIGGKNYEPIESNPMIGWRGASRYYDEKYKPAFEMECRAIRKIRDVFGLRNVWVMVPFCRTVEEAKKVLGLIKESGLEGQEDGLKVIVMCEVPSNVILANKFLEIFDGMSIGSNDLTQLTLGLDRDSALISKIGDERNEAVKTMIKKVIKMCREKGKYCGICGQAPSDFPEFVEFLLEEGIGSISLNPDTVIKTTLKIAEKEQKLADQDAAAINKK